MTGVKEKMLKIEILEETTDVFDITVEDNHNFFANDILVHNCVEVAIPVKPFSSVKELYESYQEDGGEIGLCSLAGILPANIESDEQWADVAYYALKMIDVCIHKSDYVFKNLEETAKARLSAGVGIIGLAHYMAKHHKRFDDQDGRDFIHQTSETHMWHLINASLRLGKELGNAPWIHKTLWPTGWLPTDTYEKRVDTLVTAPNVRDWDSLRKQIVKNGGIRNSVVSAMMPGESSSIASGTTNGVYPIREISIMKTNDTATTYWIAPEGTKLKKWYQSAWDISSTDMIKVYAIIQKWTDQAISADLYTSIKGSDKISSTEMIRDYLDIVKYGLKSRYYVNSNTSNGVDLNSTETAVDLSGDSTGECEGCKL
jgi:ribonucleoside-diphosphate reductase alpha chain